MINNLIDKNKPFLSEHLKNKIQNIKSEINFLTSKDGMLVPQSDGLSLHSSYYPLKESDKSEPVNYDVVIIAIGFAAGYHLVNYSKNKILAIPLDLVLLKAVLEKIDLTSFFNYNFLKIITADEIKEHFNFYKYSSFRIVMHPVLEKLHIEAVTGVIKKIKEKLSLTLLETNSYRRFGKLWLHNTLINSIFNLNHGYDLTPLEISDKPVLITGAGPSLWLNISIIKSVREKIYIAATDTSLKILEKNKIIPDFVFSFDPQNYSYLHFLGSKFNFRIFTDFISSLRLNANQTPLFSNHPLLNFFKTIGWLPVYLPSDSRNIGSAVVDFFLKYFHETTIITAGIDYGVYKNLMYSPGSYIDEYKIVNSVYFNTGENIDVNIYYKNNFIDLAGEWKRTEQLKDYSQSFINKNCFTLSGSPYTLFKKINNIDDFLKTNNFKGTKLLTFNYTKLDKEDLKSKLSDYLIKNQEVLNSYFVFKNVDPVNEKGKKDDELSKITNWIKNF